MGTLLDQPKRRQNRIDAQRVDALVAEAVVIAKKHKVDVADVIAAHRLLELERQNDLYVANGDILDEQIAGVADILQHIADSLVAAKTTR